MPHAEDLGTPETLAAIMGGIAFLVGLIVHALLRGRRLGSASLAIAVVFEALVSVTIYRDSFATDPLAGVGLIFGLAIKFAAAFAAGVLVHIVRARRPGGRG